MDTPRIFGPTKPTERVHHARDGRQKTRDEEAPEFQLGAQKDPPSKSEEERERGEVAPRSEDESGGRLDLTA